MIKYAYRVQETSVTQGTGTISLDGAVSGFRTFVEGVGNGAIVNYTIQEGANIESGIGTVTDGSPDTLSRDTIIFSTNSNNAINWGAGTRNVFLSVSPELQVWRDENLNDVSAVGVGGGTENAHTVTYDPAPFDYSDKMLIRWAAPAQNTDAVTVNVNSFGAKSYVNADLTAFPAGMIKAGSMQEAVYDAANNRFIRTTQAFDPANYATAAQGAKADTALQPSDVGTTAGKIVALDGSGKLPAVDGSLLTNVGVNTQIFTSSGTWNKPSSGTMAYIKAWAAGASGGRNTAGQGGGGGGGGYKELWMPMSALPSSVSVTIGAGGVALTTNGNGNAGGNTSFGTFLTSYGGGGGGGTTGAINSAGGGGGGSNGAGGNANVGTVGAAGPPDGGAGGAYGAAGGNASGRQAAGAGGGGGTGNGGSSYQGGAGGGGSKPSGPATDGGQSVEGGNGGFGGINNVDAGDGDPRGGGGGGCYTTANTARSGAGGRGEIIVMVF